MSSTQRSQQTSGGKWRPEYHENLRDNSLSPTSRAESSNSSPTSTDTCQRETSNETSPSSVPERTPVTPPLESDGRRRDIDGVIIESPDPDGQEYLGENATKCIACEPPKYCKVHAVQEVVHAKKVRTNPPPPRKKA